MYIFINIYRQICSLSISNIERGRQVFQTKLFHTRCSSTQSLNLIKDFWGFLHFWPWLYRINPDQPAESQQLWTQKNQLLLSSLWDLKKKTKNMWMRKKKKKVETLNPPKCVCCLAICMFKKCNQEKLSLWHNHCFLCCIDSKMFKWKKEKKTLEKDLFLYKGNFIPCLCTLFFPFSSVGCCICCAKAYSARQETIFRLKMYGERSSWLWHLGNCVAFTLPFFNLSLQGGNVFHYIFVYF